MIGSDSWPGSDGVALDDEDGLAPGEDVAIGLGARSVAEGLAVTGVVEPV